MTDTFDSPDAPPLGDEDFARTPGNPSPDATAIAVALNNVARAIHRLAGQGPDLASIVRGLSPSPGALQTPAQPQPPGAPTGPPAGSPGGNETQIKRGKKIYAICRQNEWDIADIGQRVTGHAVNPNSQKWSEAEQVAVLDAFKQWEVG